MHFNSFFLFLTSGQRAEMDFKAPSITWGFGSFRLPLDFVSQTPVYFAAGHTCPGFAEAFKAKNTFCETRVLSSLSILINRGTRCNEYGKRKTGFQELSTTAKYQHSYSMSFVCQSGVLQTF